MRDINSEQDKILGEAKQGQSGGWLQHENAAELGQYSLTRYRHRSREGEMQTCRQAGIPNSSDPEGTYLYRCTRYLKSLRGQFFTSGFWHVDCKALFPAVHVHDALAKHPFLMQRQCRVSGAWSSHSGQDDASLAHLLLRYQFGFAWEQQACQNPSGFKALQYYGTLDSTHISWEESGSAAMYILSRDSPPLVWTQAWNGGATVSAPHQER